MTHNQYCRRKALDLPYVQWTEELAESGQKNWPHFLKGLYLYGYEIENHEGKWRLHDEDRERWPEDCDEEDSFFISVPFGHFLVQNGNGTVHVLSKEQFLLRYETS